jgi:hypothetical protein
MVEFGQTQFVQRATELFEREEAVSILLIRWRKRFLLPYVRDPRMERDNPIGMTLPTGRAVTYTRDGSLS